MKISNSQILEIRREIECHSVNVICYLKCKMCNEKESCIETIQRGLKVE